MGKWREKKTVLCLLCQQITRVCEVKGTFKRQRFDINSMSRRWCSKDSLSLAALAIQYSTSYFVNINWIFNTIFMLEKFCTKTLNTQQPSVHFFFLRLSECRNLKTCNFKVDFIQRCKHYVLCDKMKNVQIFH